MVEQVDLVEIEVQAVQAEQVDLVEIEVQAGSGVKVVAAVVVPVVITLHQKATRAPSAELVAVVVQEAQ